MRRRPFRCAALLFAVTASLLTQASAPAVAAEEEEETPLESGVPVWEDSARPKEVWFPLQASIGVLMTLRQDVQVGVAGYLGWNVLKPKRKVAGTGAYAGPLVALGADFSYIPGDDGWYDVGVGVRLGFGFGDRKYSIDGTVFPQFSVYMQTTPHLGESLGPSSAFAFGSRVSVGFTALVWTTSSLKWLSSGHGMRFLLLPLLLPITLLNNIDLGCDLVRDGDSTHLRGLLRLAFSV